MTTPRGKFIVLDGIDGAGKGYQAKRLVDYLFEKDKANHVLLTREPFRSKEIRRLLKENDSPYQDAEKLAELFAADRREHLILIENVLAQGVHVVCDRYKYSTLAYQQTQGVSFDRLVAMHLGMAVPDLVLILDLPASVACARVIKDRGRAHKEVFEEEQFQSKLRQKYLDLKGQLRKELIVVINGDQPYAEVFQSITEEADKLFSPDLVSKK
ncbi:MAG: dTMP kinase [Candidatus Zambryskibacteria bacterium RIFCSPLOWO2_01_FULL_45_43]|uniref:Thymidylate kinase n=2 Tax=Parcubacteria group TaxID=1794811 RepID=A0A1G1ZVQ8_9BACT|nr:MAG: dTMP kinase [Candidatus Harrisonbacteria bacterium RIFCSPLOWO2_02_FULL_45_10c]OHB05996.1 MAG: dTMP kinase [Candidatus Zambryskibacteria bacterium RIFCSPLOWO2_01_FULL_45_43]